MDWIELCGYVGSFLSSVTFLPQVVKAWQTKSVGDLSLTMMLIVVVNTCIWIVYGIGKHANPIIVCNGIICFLALLLVYFKFNFAKNKKDI